MTEGSSRTTDSGIEVRPIYEPHPDDAVPERVGGSGSFPFTRGIYSDMYHGQTGVSVAFDLPTQMGLDSDHPRAEGEVGKTGVAIDSVDDMERLFEGIPLDQISTSMTINATAAILLLLY